MAHQSPSEYEITKDLREMIRKQEERIHNMESKALQIANLYFVFQGVVVSSTIASQSLKCHHLWFPLTLSLLATLLNLVAFIFAVFKWLKYLQGLYDLQDDYLKVQNRANENQRNTPNTTNTDAAAIAPERTATQLQGRQNRPSPSNSHAANMESKPDGVPCSWGLVFAIVATGLFVAFSIIVLVGCHAILCSYKDQVDCAKCAKNCPAW